MEISSSQVTRKAPQLDPEYYPGNYPYCLYTYQASNGVRGVRVAKSARQLAVKANLPMDVAIKPIDVLDLIKELGHVKTNAYLKQFGPNWVARSGNLFYPFEPQLLNGK